MLKIADELNKATGVFSRQNTQSVLDVCMAPGGFAEYALRQNFRCVVDAMTLPREKGGHSVLIQTRGRRNVAVTYTDITMHADLLPAGKHIPDDSPDKEEFESNRPLPHMWSYSLVICDGVRLRVHEHGMVREWEPRRLTISELIIGLTNVKPGGSLLALMHGPDHWDTVAVLYRFSQFSDIQLYKPKTSHRNRSSFYMVASNINTDLAAPWVEHLRECWYEATFGGEDGRGVPFDLEEDLVVEDVLEEFGERLIEMGRDIWTIQKEALESWDWNRNLTWVNRPGGAKSDQLTGYCPVEHPNSDLAAPIA